MRRYQPAFQPWGLLLFLVIMLPNFVWFALPAPRDVLRAASKTPALDAVASVCQAAMVAALCLLRRRDCPGPRPTPLLGLTAVCCLLYYAAWCAYYAGAATAPVILGLTVPPCLAFCFFALDRRNLAALLPAAAFTVCHVLYAVLNFLV